MTQNTCPSCGCLLTPSEQGYCDDCIANESKDEDGEDTSSILATPHLVYDKETGKASYLAGWNYDLPENYVFCKGQPVDPTHPVFQIRGVNQYGVNTLVGYAALPVALVYEGEINPYPEFKGLGVKCYSMSRALAVQERQLAEMEEYGYGD